jgi:hypothetical protein
VSAISVSSSVKAITGMLFSSARSQIRFAINAD